MPRMLAPVALAITPVAALAHPGHEAAATAGAAHWITAWDHVAVLLLAGLIAADALRRAISSLRQRRAARRAD